MLEIAIVLIKLSGSPSGMAYTNGIPGEVAFNPDGTPPGEED